MTVDLKKLNDDELKTLLRDVLEEVLSRPYPFRTSVQALVNFLAEKNYLGQVRFQAKHYEAFWQGFSPYFKGEPGKK